MQIPSLCRLCFIMMNIFCRVCELYTHKVLFCKYKFNLESARLEIKSKPSPIAKIISKKREINKLYDIFKNKYYSLNVISNDVIIYC